MAKLVTGVFNTRSSSMQAVEDLMRHGFPQEDISLQTTDSNIGREFYTNIASKAPEGGVTGTIIGAIIGGILSALVTLGYIKDPGLGLAGLSLIFSVLAGVGVGGIIGLILGAAIGAGVPEYETRFGALNNRRAGVLVGVYCHDRRAVEVQRLMQASGAKDVREKNVATEPLRIHTGPREYTPVNDVDEYPPRNAA